MSEKISLDSSGQPCCQQYDKLLNLTPNILHLIPILRAFEEKAAKKIKRGHKKT